MQSTKSNEKKLKTASTSTTTAKKHNSNHNHNHKHGRTPKNPPKDNRNSRSGKKTTPFRFSRSDKESCGGPGFTPRVGHRARDSYQNLVPVRQSQSDKSPKKGLFGRSDWFCVITVSPVSSRQNFF